MIRADLKPILFVLNNYGYTIERCLHGRTRKYNDVMNWDYTALLRTFGDIDGSKSRSYKVKTKSELDALLDNAEFASADKIQIVEMIMEPQDAPRNLKIASELAKKANKYAAEND
jgi:pyruvate decarboxylase